MQVPITPHSNTLVLLFSKDKIIATVKPFEL